MAIVIGGVLLETAISELSKAILLAMKNTLYFKSKLKEMQTTINLMDPIFNDMDILNAELDRRKEESKRFIDLLKEAKDLVQKCEHIKYNLWKRYRQASKLDKMNTSLNKLVQIDLNLQIFRNGAEALMAMREMKSEKGSSSGCSNKVPLENCVAIGFENPVRDLKAMVLKDSHNGDCSVIVVSAAGGCGKTTLVTMLCHDSQIKAKFGANIYYATIAEHHDIKVIIKKLLQRNQPCDFDSDEVAIKQWGSFLGERNSDILLVLDDVRSGSIITALKFKLPGYKILVTSRESFNQFKIYQLAVLNDQDAKRLFCRSSFAEDENEHGNVHDDLVDELVKCCKNHPLALTVIGSSLKGKREAIWIIMRNKLSKENKSFTTFHNSIRECLEKSFYLFEEEPEIKRCYQDLGLFPEDQKIAATALMDIWAHLYKHDEEGLTTMDMLTTLSLRNLATLLPLRKHLSAIANHCEEEFVIQHDMMRELAIHLSSDEPLKDRYRLILNSNGQDLNESRKAVNARILSISTDEKCPLIWNTIKAPKAEVFVLNYMSKIHPLPKFVHKKNRLKVLIITNYGYYFSEIQKFPAPKYLSRLTRIRLDHFSISSIITTILMLENLKKLSLIMCKIGDSFNEGIPNKLTNLLEIDIDSCDDLVTFPAALCNSVHLKKLSITNCHELTSLSDELGKLSNLEVLRVASCSKFIALPESVTNLKQLRIIDISHCLNLCELPNNIGELCSLRSINATGCMSLQRLPKSVEKLDEIDLLCDEEVSYRLCDFKNVKVKMVVEDPVDTFFKINPSGH